MYTYIFWFGCFNFWQFKGLCQFSSLQKESTHVKIWKLIMSGKNKLFFLYKLSFAFSIKIKDQDYGIYKNSIQWMIMCVGEQKLQNN